MLVPTHIVIEAENLAVELGISFRDCLDILMRAYLREVEAEIVIGHTNQGVLVIS